MEEAPFVAPSAHRHGYDDDEILHAFRNRMRIFTLDDLTMIVGPTSSGALIEVGVVVDDQSDLVVVHAMDARSKFLR